MARQSPARPVNRAVSMQRAHLARELVETLLLVGLIFVIVHFTIQSFSVGDTSMGKALLPNQTRPDQQASLSLWRPGPW